MRASLQREQKGVTRNKMRGLGDVRCVPGRERKTFHVVRRDWKAGWGGPVEPSFKKIAGSQKAEE